MGIIAKSNGEEYIPPPEDVHNSVCTGVFDLGIQHTNYGNKHQIYLRFELDCQKKDGTRYEVGRRYSPSLHEKATFRKVVEAWSGSKVTKQQEKDGFDVLRLLGKPCQVQVLHEEKDGKTYANVGSITKLGKGMEALKPVKNLVSFSFEDNGRNIPADVPEYISKVIQKSVNWLHSEDKGGQQFAESPEVDSEIPF